MRRERQRRGTRPGALDRDIFEVILDQLANACRAVHVGNDLEQEIRCSKRGTDRGKIDGLMLVAHGRGCDPHRAVVERADQLIGLNVEGGLGELFRKAPELAAASNRKKLAKTTFHIETDQLVGTLDY